MATTLTESKAIPIGQGQALCFGTLLFDSSVSDGRRGDRRDRRSRLLGFLGHGHELGLSGVVGPEHQKLMMYQQSAATSALTQVPNTTDLSAVTVHYGAIRPA
jgi:hypothetical protein